MGGEGEEEEMKKKIKRGEEQRKEEERDWDSRLRPSDGKIRYISHQIIFFCLRTFVLSLLGAQYSHLHTHGAQKRGIAGDGSRVSGALHTPAIGDSKSPGCRAQVPGWGSFPLALWAWERCIPPQAFAPRSTQWGCRADSEMCPAMLGVVVLGTETALLSSTWTTELDLTHRILHMSSSEGKRGPTETQGPTGQANSCE